ncbi:MAG: hypothetical protein R2940_16760 [Syntrophotaleaceae bacterium]
MRQQINLYQPELFEKKVPFCSGMMALTLAAFFLLLLAVGAASSWRLSRLESELAGLRESQDAATRRISDYQLRYPPRVADPELIQKIEKMASDRQARIALLQMLTSGQPGNSQGFSEHLTGLAQQDLASVWLRRIRLAAGGDQLLLEGSTTRASDVPLYLQGLTRQQAFTGREFEHLQLNRSEKSSQVIDFLLQTKQEEKP